MNETLQIIRDRYSCRSFKEELPSSEQLQAIAQAAIESPSGMNRQGWQIIVVKNKALISEMDLEGRNNLKKMNEEMFNHVMRRTGTLFYNAPCMFLAAIKTAYPAGAELIDLGIAAQNIVIAASSLGLASLHCGFAGLAFAGERAEEFKSRLKFFSGYEYGTSVLIGHAKEKTSPHTPDSNKITIIE